MNNISAMAMDAFDRPLVSSNSAIPVHTDDQSTGMARALPSEPERPSRKRKEYPRTSRDLSPRCPPFRRREQERKDSAVLKPFTSSNSSIVAHSVASDTALQSRRSQNGLSSVNADLHAQCLDPFDALPVRGERGQCEMLRWNFVGREVKSELEIYWVRMIRVIWAKTGWELARTNKGILHILLSIAEMTKSSLVADGAKTEKYYYHIGRALEAIKEYLSDPKQTVKCEAFTMLVSTQVSRALGEGDYESARIHMTSLCNIILRDPPWLSNDTTKRPWMVMDSIPGWFVMFNDYRLATVLGQNTMLPLEACPMPTVDHPPFIEEAGKRMLKTMEHFPPGLETSTAYQTVFLVQQMSLLWDKDYSRGLDTAYAFSITNRALYRICNLVADSRRGLGQGYALQVRPVDTLLVSVLMLAWMCLPSGALGASHPSIITQVRAKVASYIYNDLSTSAHLMVYWSAHGGTLESLLWTLFLGTIAARESNFENLGWFYSELKNTISCLGISNIEHFERSLKLYPWSSHCCARYSEPTWSQIKFRVVGVPLLTQADTGLSPPPY